MRETRHDVSLRAFAAPTAFETSAVFEIWADVQIGGGVRVGDAFQAIVGSRLIAIWAKRFCVEISQAGHLRPVRFEQERYVTGQRQPPKAKAEGRLRRAERNGVTTERIGFQALPVEFETLER